MKRKDPRGWEETRKRREEAWKKDLAIGMKAESTNRGFEDGEESVKEKAEAAKQMEGEGEAGV